MTAEAKHSQRPKRPPAPKLLEALDHTHRLILQSLGELQQLVSRIERQGVDAGARDEARALCRFFNAHARQHHADEEELVFPGLLALGDTELNAHVRRLQQDHGWLEVDWNELEPMLDALAEGIAGADAESLRSAVAVYDELYRDHIALEEGVVYPRARQLKGG